MILIEHVALWAQDLERAKTFYETYFDMRSGERYHNPRKDFTSYFLSSTAGSARLELMYKPSYAGARSPYPSPGFDHVALSLGSKEQVDALTERLRSDGYEVVGEARTTGDGYYESVVLDSEGNRLELTV